LFGRAIARDKIELDLRTQPQFRHESLVIGLTVAIGVVSAYVAGSAYASRYAAVFFSLLVLVVAGGMSRFADRRVRAAVLLVVVALSLVGGYYVATSARTQAEQIATSVAAHAEAGDLVVYCPDQLGPAGARLMPADLDQVVFPDFTRPSRIDWVDYADRNQGVDANEFATVASTRAGPDRSVFVVWSGDYRGVEDQCERVVEALSAARGPGQVLVAEDGDEYFEHAQLVWFPPGT
jgi:hypothetical protein